MAVEGQLVDLYGEAEAAAAYTNVGWMDEAQQRETWKAMEDVFAIFNTV